VPDELEFPLIAAGNRTAKDKHLVKASFEGRNVSLAEDFAVQYQLDPKRADTLDVITYRNPDSGQPDAAEKSSVNRGHNEPGFFGAQVVFGSG
jgi:hypothetical protein